MRLDITPPPDGAAHQYCVSCRAEAVERVWVGERTYYSCQACGRRAERSIVIDPVVGDQCRRGADAHRWHAFTATVPAGTTVTVRDEGARPVWMTLDQALAADVTVPVRRVIEEFAPTGMLAR